MLTPQVFHRSKIFLVAFLLASFRSFGQTPAVDFICLSLENGLSQSSVTQIFQDRTGFMWFGTMDGLNKYDGHSFRVFRNDPADSNSLSDDYITAIAEDANGYLWIGTNSGNLDRFDPENESWSHFGRLLVRADSPEKGIISCIVEDDTRMLWIGTLGNGLWRLDPARGTSANYLNVPSDPSSINHNSIWSIVKDGTGSLWFGTYDGLCTNIPGSDRFTQYRIAQTADRPMPNRINALLVDRVGTLWCSSWGNGVFTFDRVRRQFQAVEFPTSSYSRMLRQGVIAFAQDDEGSIWMGTWNAGALVFDGRILTRYNHRTDDPRSLSSDDLLSIEVDRAGNVWLGTNSSGVNRFSSAQRGFSTFRHFSTDENSLAHDNVRAFAEDADGSLWIGMNGGGVDRLNPKTRRIEHYGPSARRGNGLMSDKIGSLLMDTDGTLWVGSQDAGLFRLDPGQRQFRRYHALPGDRNSLQGNTIISLQQDPSGKVWIGTYGAGLHLLDKRSGRMSRFAYDENAPAGIAQNTVTAMLHSRNGAFWIGTYSNGLDRYDGRTFTHFRSDPSQANALSNDRILSLYEDGAGILWIGTWGGGLCRFDPRIEIFTRYSQKDGLPNSTIYGILGDGRGNLWLSTNYGLVLFDTATGSVRTYHRNDGIQHDEFNQGAFLRLRNGEMVFGGIAGFTRFHPDSIYGLSTPPPVVMTSFEILGPARSGVVVRSRRPISLAYDQNFFRFEFAALDYANPAQNQYAYMLEGFDRSWIRTAQQYDATYTNVPPGEYTIRIAAASHDGLWNWDGVRIPLTIDPPPWKTATAYLFYVIAIAGAAGVLFRWRQRKRINELALFRTQLSERERQLAQERLVSEHLRRAEEALAENDRMLRRAQEIARMGSWEWYPESDRFECSDELLKILGVTRDQFGGTLAWIFEELIHPEDRALSREAVEKSLARRAIVAVEYRIIHGSAESRWVRSVGELIYQGDILVKVLGTTQDITDRKRAEESLRHAQKLESIGTLAGGIAHDFNNLLNAILGQSSLALGKLPKESPAGSNLSKAINAAERAADLTRQLLAYSGKGKFVTEDIDLNRLVKDNLQILEVSVPKTARLHFDLDSSTPHIRGDVGQIQQVIMNLIINAGEALEANPGEIHVRTERISLSAIDADYWRYTHDPLLPGEYVRLRVSDTGRGIGHDSLSKIFDPFYSTKFTGRGLGLAAVLGIVRGHQGGICITSEVGKGTQFDIAFPVVHAEKIQRSDTASEPQIIEGTGKTVLVIDDEPFVLDLVRDIFSDAKYSVLGTLNPIEGIELYRRHRKEIVAVVLDYSMPGMDGKTTFEELRKIDPSVKVLLCSGYSEEETASVFGDIRPAGFIQKPYKPSNVLDLVQKMLT